MPLPRGNIRYVNTHPQVAARVRPDVQGRLDAIASALAARVPGSKGMTRSDALRAVIERGVVAMEAELGLVAATK